MATGLWGAESALEDAETSVGSRIGIAGRGMLTASDRLASSKVATGGPCAAAALRAYLRLRIK